MPDIHEIILDVKGQAEGLETRADEMEAFLDDMHYTPYQKEATVAALSQAETDLNAVKSSLETIAANLAAAPPPIS